MTVAANLSAETAVSLEHDLHSIYVFGTSSASSSLADLLTAALHLQPVASTSPVS